MKRFNSTTGKEDAGSGKPDPASAHTAVIRARIYKMLEQISDQGFLSVVQDMVGDYHSSNRHRLVEWQQLMEPEAEEDEEPW